MSLRLRTDWETTPAYRRHAGVQILKCQASRTDARQPRVQIAVAMMVDQGTAAHVPAQTDKPNVVMGVGKPAELLGLVGVSGITGNSQVLLEQPLDGDIKRRVSGIATAADLAPLPHNEIGPFHTAGDGE